MIAVKNTPWRGPNLNASMAAFNLAFTAPILSIDLDNVIRDQIGSIIEATRARYGVSLSRADFNQWDPPLGQRVGISNEEFTAWAWTDRDIFASARPVSGAAQALANLSRKYYIIITTSTRWPELTAPWLDRWEIPHHEVIHTSDKTGVIFDWHIDDSPSILASLAKANRVGVRWALPWNEGQPGPVLSRWGEAERLINSLTCLCCGKPATVAAGDWDLCAGCYNAVSAP